MTEHETTQTILNEIAEELICNVDEIVVVQNTGVTIYFKIQGLNTEYAARVTKTGHIKKGSLTSM